jgi:hypothetical protein
VLQKSHRNRIFTAITAAGLDPQDFELFDQAEVRIKRKLSESCFVIGGDASHYVGHYVVGDGPEWALDAYSWEAVIRSLGIWLADVKRDLETPDLWAGLQQDAAVLLRAYSDDTTENTPFTVGEQNEIASRLRELAEYVKLAHALSAAQRRDLDANVDFAIESLSRLGKIDWRNAFVGALVGYVFAAGLAPDSARAIFLHFLRGIGHFCFPELISP